MEALNWYGKAGMQGHAEAQYAYALGMRYLREGFVPEEILEKVMLWYRAAAEQGHAAAQCCLGDGYSRGMGVTKDVEEAMQWYRKAAMQGHADGQFNLGCCYTMGEGVAKDLVEAWAWANLALGGKKKPTKYSSLNGLFERLRTVRGPS